MRTFALLAATALLIGGCSGSSSNPPPGSGGSVSTGGTSAASGGSSSSSTSSVSTGGVASGGVTAAGAGGKGGSGSGGTSTVSTGGTAGTASGGATSPVTGGKSGSGGATSPGSGGSSSGSGGSPTAGAGGSSTGGVDAGGGAQSPGCGKTRTLQNGTINITFNGASRKYILRVPDSYDNSHPYRLVLAYAESGSSAKSVVDRNYYTLATLDSKSTTIFAAPDAANGAGSWSKSDVELTDAILAQLEGDLCIDTTRIFATGFSFGGAMSIALACTRADVFRGVAFFSGADLTGSCPATLTKPIAYYASQASGDSSGTPMPSSGKVKQAEFAAVNGCTAEPGALNFPSPGQPHTCTIYKNCSAGHPTVYCIFDGPHSWDPKDPGQSTSWNPGEAWKFITQF